jgi:hypothetical protein
LQKEGASEVPVVLIPMNLRDRLLSVNAIQQPLLPRTDRQIEIGICV